MNGSFFRIAVVGGIAVGKSTIVEALTEHMDHCQVILEDVSQNIFLEDFYDDMYKWGFHSRISTLAMITANYLSCDIEKYNFAVFDRCVDELITFAQMHYDKGNMSQKEFIVYSSLYKSIISIAPKIDLFVFCKCSPEISLERIKKRNRLFEQGIDISYLRDINSYYEKWISSINPNKVETIDTSDKLDIGRLENIIKRFVK